MRVGEDMEDFIPRRARRRETGLRAAPHDFMPPEAFVSKCGAGMLLAVWTDCALRSGLWRRCKGRRTSAADGQSFLVGVPEQRPGSAPLGGSFGAHSLQIVRRTDPTLTNMPNPPEDQDSE